MCSEAKVRVLTGCRHGHYRWEMQSDGDHHEGCHCDGLGEERRCDHARNGEPRLGDKVLVSMKFFESGEHAQSAGR
jgi:hypothetical protein